MNLYINKNQSPKVVKLIFQIIQINAFFRFFWHFLIKTHKKTLKIEGFCLIIKNFFKPDFL